MEKVGISDRDGAQTHAPRAGTSHSLVLPLMYCFLRYSFEIKVIFMYQIRIKDTIMKTKLCFILMTV